MKKSLVLAGVLSIAGAVSAVPEITDSFDWGTGVAGREPVAAGASIDGLTAQTGGGVWRSTGKGPAVFSGKPEPETVR